MGFRGGSLASSLVLLGLAALTYVTPAWGDSRTQLALTNYADMVVDAGNARVFVSGGSGNNSIVVLDYNGAVVATIDGQEGAAGMVLDGSSSTMYVALQDADAISAIDTTTLTETSRFSVAPSPDPEFLALAGGRLWFSFDCRDGASGMASVLPDGTQRIDYPRLGGAYPYYCPTFATSPTDPNLLVATDIGLSPPTVYVYDVESAADPLTVTTSKRLESSGDFDDMVVTPDGTRLLVAAGAPYSIQTFALADLAEGHAYPTGPYSNAVAVTSDESHVAAGRYAPWDPDLHIFPSGSTTAQAEYEFSLTLGTSGGVLYPGGLAFSPDASKLFAVTQRSSSAADFRVLEAPTVERLPTTVTTASSSSRVAYNGRVTLTAHVGAHSGGTLSIYATPFNGTKTLLRTAAPGFAGNVTATYVLKRRTTFTAEYSGDAVYAPALSAGLEVLVRALTTATLTNYYGTSGGYRLYRLGRNPVVRGAVAPNQAGLFLTFVAQRYSSGRWRAGTSAGYRIGTNGTVTASLLHTTRGTYRIRTIFPGSTSNLASSSPWRYLKVT